MKVNISVDLTPAEARELMGFEGALQMQQVFLKALANPTEDPSLFSSWLADMAKNQKEILKKMAPYVSDSTPAPSSDER